MVSAVGEWKISRVESCTALGCGKWHHGLKRVENRFPSATGTSTGSDLCRSRLKVQAKQLYFMGSHTNPICYH